jgi:hypothetical protein
LTLSASGLMSALAMLLAAVLVASPSQGRRLGEGAWAEWSHVRWDDHVALVVRSRPVSME